LVLVAVGAGLLWWWPASVAPRKIDRRLPETDSGPKQQAAVVDWPGEFIAGDGAPGKAVGDWPAFRGPNRNGISPQKVRLARSWPADGPERLWAVSMGDGYAGAAVAGGRVYVLDYDEQRRGDALRCLSLADGREIWRRWYKLVIKPSHGMSRAVPAVRGRHVVTIGPKCHVMCVDAETGAFRWGMDLVRKYDAKVPSWYASQCALIENGRAIIAPGGTALMIAVDCQSGKVLWETPNPRGWHVTYSSIMPMELPGGRTYVYCATGGVAGVAAESGKLLWQTDSWRVSTANSPSPLFCGEGRIFLTGSYNAGSKMIRVKAAGDGAAVEVLWTLKPGEFSSEQQTPILHDGHIFGLREDGRLICLGLDGRIVWESDRSYRFGRKGRGPYLLADSLLVVLDGDGWLSLIEATTAGFRPITRAQVLKGAESDGRIESWAPMALVDGRLIARDVKQMVCLDLRSR